MLFRSPIVAVVDTNCNPEGIDYPIPGNDDAIRAITLFISIIANAVIEADNETGLRIIEDLNDDEEIETDAAKPQEENEIVDFQNYTPTEEVKTEEKEVEADTEVEGLVDENDLYK